MHRSAYFVLQPVITSIVSTLVVLSTAAPHYGLKGPGFQHLGALGVFAGLYLVIGDDTKDKRSNQKS